ncbi:MAG: glycoside hydrolase [Vicinamibacteria bacterium]|nr:glycoside hydrolase [Vicinamibacteria bacterium]
MKHHRLLVSILALFATVVSAQPFDPSLFSEMKWRMIGPYRGGRTKSAVGVPSRPGLFYIGVVNGGVWKTTDYGHTWNPIFDDQPTGSIGAIAIAPSNPDIIYVGSGEGLQRPDLSTGDGIYKSTDAGKTWVHLGLRDGQQIPQIVVDSRDPNRLFVAVLGHPYGPNEERGLFKSTDGGETFTKSLYKDENTGAIDVVLDPSNPDNIYAAMWEARQAPWENGVFSGPGSGLFKSTDGGVTWKPLTKGLPTFEKDIVGRIGVTIAPSLPSRLFATVETRESGESGFLYRSDDSGESWNRISDDPYIVGRPSDFAEVKVHPTNPDILFTASRVMWKSTDGGKTFTAIKGAPGGDDYHRIWINPKDPNVMVVAADQGAVVTANGGATWTSWYNQPTAQMYHVSTDNNFPYRVCSGQQESGSACVLSRGHAGAITFRDWTPVGVEEYGYVAADPLNPDIVYGGKVTRFDRRTGQTKNVSPKPLRGDGYRVVRTQPVLFSPVDPKILYFASNTVWKTTNGGDSWESISPDLTRKTWDVPKNVGKYIGSNASKATQRGVVYALAPSPLDVNLLWAGTDDGFIHVTRDGGAHWTDVTPPSLGPWAKVSIMDASHSDRDTAYAAINTLRLDDLRPHILRTRDGGKTWQEIISGLPDGAPVNVVRADPRRAGLLFAGTETTVYVSFNDGDSWQSLRVNLPATSIRDLVIKDDDLVIGTHGRSFWILDDITPLRQWRTEIASSDVHLFAPQAAWRVRWNMNTDTPLPPEEPVGQNPPDGAVLNYFLKADVAGLVRLDVMDASGKTVRSFRSDDKPEPWPADRDIPDYWIRPHQPLLTRAGLHRFVWDLHYPPPQSLSHGYPISGVFANTWLEPRGPWVPPGSYTARLTANGETREQSFMVKMDPRLEAPATTLRTQFDLSMRAYSAMNDSLTMLTEVRATRTALTEAMTKQKSAKRKAALEAADRTLAPFDEAGFARANQQMGQILDALQEVDDAPTTQLLATLEEKSKALADLMAAWPKAQAAAKAVGR